MGRIEIVDKLNLFLDKHAPFTEECHVLYTLVEIRKVLDRENNRKYPILRFYCNWSVHTDKDSTKEMEVVMKDIYEDIKKQIANPALVSGKTKIIGFMYMEDLQAEVLKFLQEYQLPISLTEKSNWLEFVKLFVKILVDQPIKTPSVDIKQFAFLPAAEGCVRGRIDFNQNIGQYSYYQFGNAY
ncbi:hypothetical protein A2996_01080 [Candidatus Campbellbacteria bacterium RIFCSPLOWO2_01_FULL_34_15]|uniref:Uncharacterized protein n=1 Tax=Candidatus Campbellbacteria bacterium RIFCSPLOWO2_01_FULL_34_15 TaxID=1797579 RepID=A0A1F5ELE3_9BACT|nr:MAG: hypothetical protein A2996_01080 [Candidatus Campbellbacteria bacterium RIFCSPLOWO2_01_FULL_34_15]